MASDEIVLFALDGSKDYGERIARHLGAPLAVHEERGFEDGEHKARPLVNVRRREVYVVHSLHGDARRSVNDKLCRLLFFIGALRDAAAERVTAIVPYLCYARKDRKTKSRDPVTTRYVAALFEAVGADRVVTLDVHNIAAFQNAFRCATEHLEAKLLFVEHFAGPLAGDEVTVLSPDSGGIKRAEEFRRALGDALGRPLLGGFMEKRRSWGAVTGETLFAEVQGRTVVIIDDLISSGTTILRAAKAARAAGARRVYAAASHGVFSADAAGVLADAALDRVVITDTVPPLHLPAQLVAEKVTVLDAAPLFGEAIRRIHSGGSLVELLRTEG
jgi:ribose-phosphate pyrophosphokinase